MEILNGSRTGTSLLYSYLYTGCGQTVRTPIPPAPGIVIPGRGPASETRAPIRDARAAITARHASRPTACARLASRLVLTSACACQNVQHLACAGASTDLCACRPCPRPPLRASPPRPPQPLRRCQSDRGNCLPAACLSVGHLLGALRAEVGRGGEPLIDAVRVEEVAAREPPHTLACDTRADVAHQIVRVDEKECVHNASIMRLECMRLECMRLEEYPPSHSAGTARRARASGAGGRERTRGE